MVERKFGYGFYKQIDICVVCITFTRCLMKNLSPCNFHIMQLYVQNYALYSDNTVIYLTNEF